MSKAYRFIRLTAPLGPRLRKGPRVIALGVEHHRETLLVLVERLRCVQLLFEHFDRRLRCVMCDRCPPDNALAQRRCARFGMGNPKPHAELPRQAMHPIALRTTQKCGIDDGSESASESRACELPQMLVSRFGRARTVQPSVNAGTG